MKRMVAGVLGIAVAGCATVGEVDPAMAKEANAPLLCEGKDQCDLYWRRAQVWLASNSHYRIQSATDTVISTHGPTQHSVDRAYQIVRVPLSSKIDQITIQSGCANIFGCSTNELERALSFKRYVRGPN